MLERLPLLSARIASQIRLLREDPERFGKNLLQYTAPAEFEARLLDVLRQPDLQVVVTPGIPASLNVLQPVLRPEAMTGGPNTIVLLAALIAECGVPVRIVTSQPKYSTDLGWFARHVATLLGRPGPGNLTVHEGADAASPLTIGGNDLWLATHWTTAQALRPQLPKMHRRWFVYLVQDYEPGFYAWSSNYALALETYGMPHRAIINERFLAEYLRLRAPGCYQQSEFVDSHCVVFEPAVDRRIFRPLEQTRTDRPRRLLVYARPTNPRNMLGLAIEALRIAVRQGVFSEGWEFLSIGSRGSMPKIDLGKGQFMRPANWQDYAGYAASLQNAEVLLCPMLSPHTSYPVLEMAACGGVVVTNTYGPKTSTALAALSPEIIGVEPTIQGFVDGLSEAARREEEQRKDRLCLPGNWDQVLRPVSEWVAAAVLE